MIDIHCHLLPGLDDGSDSLDHSLELAQAAVADGITHALMTPHHMNGRYVNHAPEVAQATADFQDALDAAQIPLVVFASQEVRINGELLTALDAGDILTTDPFGTYMLLEFPSEEVPAYSEKMIFDIQQRGIIPIIVHPERNQGFMDKPEQLYEFINRGALAQVTASSYVGVFGKKVQAFAQDIIDNGLAQFLASDAHYMENRDYVMGDAFAQLVREKGQKTADLFDKNAKAAINGDPIQRLVPQPIKKKRFFAKY
ncbi:tyrosine protein phosphatase [Weissella viridescens]|uniref:Tyrosine-protein phosphatase n=1 Tax=Weissella viridescens TaxID=1629 RepID=A0A3P2RKF6_WEIVI|nr:CpsB/CapC family capsule biosynthesis tyrosine phosphatase [Weissella viridescens]RRG18152.1 tyrosine protein phosphatase [Weissella viridescens]